MPSKDTDDRPVVKQLPTGGVAVNKDISRQRRKIVKASAAVVPAIMTIRSGVAAAMASTYQCTARDNRAALAEIGPDAYALETNQDHWLRVMGKKVTKNVQGTEKIIYCTETGPGGPNPADAWQCFNEDGTEYSGNLSVPTITNGDNVALLVFLNFDEYGNDTGEAALYYPIIQTVQPAPPGYSPLTGSCLASIHPNLNLLG